MKGLGIFMIGLLAVAGGIAAATYVTKKNLEKETEDDYFDNWDDDDELDDSVTDVVDFDFDDDSSVDDKDNKDDAAETDPVIPEVNKQSNDLFEALNADEDEETEEL
jgi:hypothetical protein